MIFCFLSMWLYLDGGWAQLGSWEVWTSCSSQGLSSSIKWEQAGLPHRMVVAACYALVCKREPHLCWLCWYSIGWSAPRVQAQSWYGRGLPKNVCTSRCEALRLLVYSLSFTLGLSLLVSGLGMRCIEDQPGSQETYSLHPVCFFILPTSFLRDVARFFA